MRPRSTIAIAQCARRALTLVLLAALVQTACVYRMPIQQGNSTNVNDRSCPSTTRCTRSARDDSFTDDAINNSVT